MLDIIIVEDNHEIGELLSDFLRNENYIVSVAKDGEAALELFERYGAKLVILDLMLPGMDGFAVCSKIRETSNAHILIVSAKTEKNDKLKGLNLGADDYIEKPRRMRIYRMQTANAGYRTGCWIWGGRNERADIIRYLLFYLTSDIKKNILRNGIYLTHDK